MNADKLAELRTRAERATAVARDIEALTEADPHKCGGRFSFVNKNTHIPIINDSLLTEMLALGRLALLGKKEAELAALLGEQTAVDLTNLIQPFSTDPGE